MKQSTLFTETSAVFSPCRRWRYTLERIWSPHYPICMFVGLNPSTADETQNDPTVRRCMRYAREWGYGGLLMLNLFAFRATLPGDMREAGDPVGPDNDTWLIGSAKRASLVVAAWGTNGNYQNRDQNILKIFQEAGIVLRCLKVTRAGFPGHPLYLPGHLLPVAFP